MANDEVTATSAYQYAESESAEPSTSLDDPSNLDFQEPDDEATPETEGETESADETDESEDGQEAETTDETEEGSEDEGEDADTSKDDPDKVLVTLSGGEQVSLTELKRGYFRERDYRHKTTELGEKRRGLDELTTRVTNSVNAIADFLAKQLPEAPDTSLAMTDPGGYVRAKAMYDASMAQINAIIEQANAPKEVANTLKQEQTAELLQAENAKLAEAFPQTANPDGRKKFFDRAAGAAKELGYSEQEIQGVTDNRMFKLAYYARLGLEAEQAKAKAAKKVENVPPVVPNKRQAGKSAAHIRTNQEAVKRLQKTGSIHDAMAIDFD